MSTRRKLQDKFDEMKHYRPDVVFMNQGRRRLLESGTAIEHRLCSPSVDGTRRGGGNG